MTHPALKLRVRLSGVHSFWWHGAEKTAGRSGGKGDRKFRKESSAAKSQTLRGCGLSVLVQHAEY
ncbi:MAG: hypothetical protein AAFP90_18010 [Planctomycetota bacterium]